MGAFSVPRHRLSLLVFTLPLIAALGCGGNKSSTPPIQPVEVLYAAGTTPSNGPELQIFPIDPSNGTLGTPAAQNNVDIGQSAITITPSSTFYYSAEPTGIYGYSIGSSGILTPLAGSPFPENLIGPLSAAMDPAGQFLYVSGGNDFDIAVFSIDSSSGALTPVPGSPFSNNGSYTNRITLSPTGSFLYVVNGGYAVDIDGISAFTVNRTTGSLTPVNGGTLSFPDSGTPAASIAIDPGSQYLYVCELDGIHAFTIDQSTGTLAPFPTEPLVSLSQPVQLTMNSAGTTLYVAALGNGSISAYSIDSSTGALTEVAGSPYPVTTVFRWNLKSI